MLALAALLTVLLVSISSHFALAVRSEFILPLHTVMESSAAVVSLMIFTIGWQTYGTDRSWPITLLASLFLGVGILDVVHLLSYPGMPNLITANTWGKTTYFSLAARLFSSIALLIAAGAANYKPISGRLHRQLLAGVIIALLIVYPIGIFHSDWLADQFLDTDRTRESSALNIALLLIYGAAAALLTRRWRTAGFSWMQPLLIGSSILGLAEINCALSRHSGDLSFVAAHVLKILASIYIYRAVFLHSIQIPIDQMNAWKAQLQISQRELNITKLAVDGSNYYIFMSDPDGRLLYASDNACKRVGYTPAELVGKDGIGLNLFSGTTMPKDWSPLMEHGHISFEETLTTKSGEQFPVEVTTSKFREDDGTERFCVVIHEISERKRFEAKLEENARHLRRVIDSVPFFVAVLTPEGNIVDINKMAMLTFPFDEQKIRGKFFLALLRPFPFAKETITQIENAIRRSTAGESVKCDINVGDEHIEFCVVPVHDDAGKIVNLIATGTNITARVKAQNQLKLASTAFDQSAEAILITDGDIRILSVNRAFTTLTGFDQSEVLGTTPTLFDLGIHLDAMRASLAASGNWSGEVEWLHKDGHLCYEWVTVTKVLNSASSISNYIVIFSDISEKKRAEERIQYLAYYDPLTNLPNRVLLEDRITQAIAAAKREQHKVAVIFLDLDHFKTINDSLGHQYGDKILRDVANRLKASVRELDTVARQGGDEFVIVLPNLQTPAQAADICRKLLAELARPYLVGDSELRLTVSIGISIYPDDGDDFSRMVMNADAAMYHAKDMGRNNAQFYIGDMNLRAAELLTMENRLRRAIEREEFILHFQPQVDFQTGNIVGFEALVRWNDPEHGLVPPNDFIPVAEERGLIVPIGEWVLRTACLQNRAWQDAGMPKLPIAVNISASQFRQENLVAIISAILQETGLDPRYLELEVTESVVMYDAEKMISTLEQLRDLGVYLAVDDFGTGYSSLSYLKRFPIDKLKIDRSFVRDIPGDKDDYSIVRAIIGLSQQLNLKVVAEGVETIEQLTALRASACDQFQGFYFSRPVLATAAEKLLRDERDANNKKGE